MKNILLATTALAMTAGYASAEMSISASAKIAYGNFGEEHNPGNASKSATNAEGGTIAATGTSGFSYFDASAGSVVAVADDTAAVTLDAGDYATAGTNGTAVTTGGGYAYSDTFDVVVSGSGEAGGVAYSGSMTIDEDAASNSVGTLSMSTGGFSLAYGADDFGDLVADNANGLEEAAGDIKLSYAANGISASYEMDEAATNPYYMRAGYTNGALTVGLEVADTDGSGTGSAVNTISLGYTMGALTVSYDADDKASVTGDNSAGSDYDAKITYTMGATVLSAGTDEVQAHYAGLTTTIGGLTLTMRTEQDGKKYTGTTDLNGNGLTNGANLSAAENELSLSYTMGALTVAYAKDTGDAGKFGDEAETLTTLTYDLGGVTIVAKGNDQDETEVSAAFTF
jgi:outer membrane protein OmpU